MRAGYVKLAHRPNLIGIPVAGTVPFIIVVCQYHCIELLLHVEVLCSDNTWDRQTRACSIDWRTHRSIVHHWVCNFVATTESWRGPIHAEKALHVAMTPCPELSADRSRTIGCRVTFERRLKSHLYLCRSTCVAPRCIVCNAVFPMSVCLSVCLSNAWIVTKRKHLAKKVQLWLIGSRPRAFQWA